MAKQCWGSGSASGFRTFLPDLDPEASPPDPDLDPNPAMVMDVYQAIISEKMFFTNLKKNCHDLDTM